MKNLRLLRKSVAFQILLLSAVFISFSNYMPNQEDKPSLYAFIIGATPPDIKWTVEDAEDMKEALLLQKNRGLYADVVVETLTGTDASAAGIIKNIRQFIHLNKITKKDVFIFYVSSHGYRDGRKFSFQASDFDQLLKEILDEVSAKKLLFIDACESGYRNPKPERAKFGVKGGNAQEDFKEILNAKSGYTIITSSVGDSYHYDGWKNSAFTESFLEGLTGKADADQNGYITTTEIYNYLNTSVPILCKELLLTDMEIQRPDYLRFKADIPFIALEKGTYTADPVSLPTSHTESGVLYYGDYGLNYKPSTQLGEPEKWEHQPITLFEDYQNGKPYLEGRVIFMGTENEIGLRIEIAIEGEATGYFGRDLPLIVINMEGTKKRYITSDFSYMYTSQYDPIRDKTFYVMAYDFTKQDKKLMESRKITSVDVGWQTGRKRYKVTNPDTFARQLNNINRAEEDGIIEKLKLAKK